MSMHQLSRTARFPVNILLMTALKRLFLFLLSGTLTVQAQAFPFVFFDKAGESYRLTVGPSPLHYYRLQHSDDLYGYSMLGMAQGMPGPVFMHTPPPGTLKGFYRVQAIEGWAPEDTDLDGMDDLWELQNGLNPLDAADAAAPSVPNPPQSNLAYYRERFGLTRVTEYLSAETSVYNSPFAISAETSVYNFPNLTGASLEAVSSEVSVYRFTNVTGASLEAISAEVSVFNTPPLASAPEAISAEVSVFNTPPLFVTPEAISNEVSVFNAYTPPATTLAISPEVSVLKN
jgi:hypothetical protein